METSARHTLVGAFVLVILAGIFVMVIWLAKLEPGKQNAYYDIYFFGSVTGLNDGAPVRYNGVQIGRVEGISLDPANIERIRVTINVDRPAVIKEGAVASLELQGITGYAYVQISGGSKDAPSLDKKEGERNPVIASSPSRIEKVFQSAPELLERALLISDRLAAMLDDKNRDAVAETLQNIQGLTKNIEGVTAALGEKGEGFGNLMTDASKTLNEASQTMQEARKALASLTRLTDGLNGAVTGKDGPLERLNTTLVTADSAIRKLGDFSTKLDAMVSENRPALREFSQRGLTELNSLIQEARQMVGGISRLASEIERDPARFFFGDRREGYRPR